MLQQHVDANTYCMYMYMYEQSVDLDAVFLNTCTLLFMMLVSVVDGILLIVTCPFVQ